MKLLSLELLAFGAFTDRRLDLTVGDGDFHVIYGDNEAGKSTTLRALTALLYGIPARTNDAFVHGYGKLRVGGRLRRSDGQELAIIRRKGNKNTLLDASEAPLADEVLAPFLAGVDEQRFTSAFGIDHAALTRGAEELLSGGGEVGRSLFAAALGAVSLRGVVTAFEKDADALFLPNGKNPKINRTLSKFNAASKKVRELSLPSREWAEQDEALAELQRRSEQEGEALEGARTEHERLLRLQRALPHVGRRRELLAELDEHREVVALPADFAARRRGAAQRLAQATAALDNGERERRRVQDEIDALTVPEELLARAPAVTELHQRLGAYREAAGELPSLTGQRDQLDADARAVHAELGLDVPLDAVAPLRPKTTQRARINDLAARHQRLISALDGAGRDRDKATAALEKARAKLEALPPPQDASALRALIDAQQPRGDLEAAHDKLARDITKQRAAAEVELAALGRWSGSLGEIERLAVPEAETIEVFLERMADGAAAAKDASEGLKKQRAELRTLDKELAALNRGDAIPTEADLGAARTRREAGWVLIQRGWRDGEEVTAEARAFDAEHELATAYERSVAAADTVADRLRGEADRVAKNADLNARRLEAEAGIERIEAEREAREARQAATRAEWMALWTPLGITPGQPREMRGWLSKLRMLRGDAARIREQEVELAALSDEIDAQRRDLFATLTALGEPGPAEGESTLASRTRAQRVIEALSSREQTRASLDEQIADHRAAVDAAEAQAAAKDEDIAAWAGDWTAAVAALNLPPSASTAEARAVLEGFDALFAKLDEAEKLSRRIDELAKTSARFEVDVEALVVAVAPELAGRAPAEAAATLYERMDQAKTDATTRKELAKQLTTLDRQREEDEASQAAAKAALTELCAIAGRSRPDELEAAEQAHSARVELERQLAQVDETLSEMAAGATVEALVAEAEGIDGDALPGRIEVAEGRVKEIEARRAEINQEIGRAREKLARLDGSGEAARAAEEAEELLAKLSADVERYARLRLASELLRREIERYREEHQGPLMARARELFRDLTLGSFTDLRTDYDDKDQPVIMGVRSGDERVGVEGMSDGTRDQLYLAIRLATLEGYLAAHEPIPFVVDDVLIHFDDTRAGAALKVLRALSRHTQVLFFTHHERLVELATGLGAGAVQVHRLDRAVIPPG